MKLALYNCPHGPPKPGEFNPPGEAVYPGYRRMEMGDTPVGVRFPASTADGRTFITMSHVVMMTDDGFVVRAIKAGDGGMKNGVQQVMTEFI